MADFDAFDLIELVNTAEQKAALQALDKSTIKDFTESVKYERTKAHNDEFNASGGKRTKKPTPASPAPSAATASNPASGSADDDDGDDSASDSAEEAGTTVEESAASQGDQPASSVDVLGTSPSASKLERLMSRTKGPKPGAKSPPPAASSTCEKAAALFFPHTLSPSVY